MKTLTLEEQLANNALAQRLWKERVKPEDITRELARWRCGTQACFGGHLSTWPEFQAMGVTTYGRLCSRDDNPDAPCFIDIDTCETSGAYEVCEHLFGDEMLFRPEGSHEADVEMLWQDEHEMVTNRLVYNAAVLNERIRQRS